MTKAYVLVTLKWHESFQQHFDGRARLERRVWWAHWNWDDVLDEKGRMVGHQLSITELAKGHTYRTEVRFTLDGNVIGGKHTPEIFNSLEAAQRHCDLWMSDMRRQQKMIQRYEKRREKGAKAPKGEPNEKWKALRF